MSYLSGRSFFACLALGFLLLANSSAASAECSDSRIKHLYQNGRTVASIAKTCEMDKEEIQDVLDSEDEETGAGAEGTGEGSGEQKLPSGTPVGQCGCWGYVDPNYRQPQAQCKSGYAQPRMCPAQCPQGGYAWTGVCT